MANDPWVVFDYEGIQLEEMCRLLQKGNADYARLSGGLKNAVVESALLHIRILVDILLSRGKGSDDIRLVDLLPEFQSHDLQELRHAYGGRDQQESPCWTLNKMLAHPTLLRSESYDYTPLLNSLVPLIFEVVKNVNAKAGRLVEASQTATQPLPADHIAC